LSTSNWQNISYNIQLVKLLNPQTILDIGVGFGRWGILFREFLEVWGDNNFECNWKRTIDGLEIFPDYIKDYHKFFYDNIHICNALDYLRSMDKHYDLINLGDVVEHFVKEEGLELIDLCLKKSKHTLINIPIGKDWEQDAINGNEFERHRSSWSIEDFSKHKFSLISEFEDIELRTFAVILLSDKKIDLTQAYGKHFAKKNFIGKKLKLKGLIKLYEKSKKKK